MALCIGWGYLALVMWLDIGGWGSWLSGPPVGRVVGLQMVALLGVAFGAVGAHVGVTNVMGETVRAGRAVQAERRAAMRRWQCERTDAHGATPRRAAGRQARP